MTIIFCRKCRNNTLESFFNVDSMSLLVHECIVEQAVTLPKTKDDVPTQQIIKTTPRIGDQQTTGES